MAFCGNCGSKLPEGALFCGNCGTKQQTPVAPAVEAPVYVAPTAPVAEAPVYVAPTAPVAEAPIYDPPAAPVAEAPIYDPATAPVAEEPVYIAPVEEQPVYAQPEQPVYAQPEQPFYAPVYEQTYTPQSEQPKKKNIWKILLPIIGGVVLIALIAVLVLFLGKTHVEDIEFYGEDEIQLLVDDTYRVEYEVFPVEHDDELYWESSNEDVAIVRNGKITAVGAGECEIYLRSAKGVSDSIDVEVQDVVYVEKITLDVDSLFMTPGESYTVSWSVSPSNANEEITWSSSDTSVAEVDAYGKITTVGEGDCSIYIRSEFGYEEELNVTVSSLSKEEAPICRTWTSYAAYIEGESDYFSDMEMVIYEDHTGVLRFDGDEMPFEWSYDFDDADGAYYYDAYAEDGTYFWFAYNYDGEWEGDLDVCLEDEFWVYFR